MRRTIGVHRQVGTIIYTLRAKAVSLRIAFSTVGLTEFWSIDMSGTVIGMAREGNASYVGVVVYPRYE